MDSNIEQKSGSEVDNDGDHRHADARMDEEDQPAWSSAVTGAAIKRARNDGDDEMVLESGEFQRSAAISAASASYHCDETTQSQDESVGECEARVQGSTRATERHSECHASSQEARENTVR